MTKNIELSYFPQVAEVICLPVFQGSQILGGARGLENLVEGVNLSDTPEYYKWLSSGEIMITTCYSIHYDPAAISEFIQSLAKKGIAAVCIKSAQYLKQIPQIMIDQANQYNLPLIELPDSVQFSDLIKGISDELLKRQTAMLRSTLQINEMLTSTIIEGAGLEEIAHMTSQLAGTSVLILDTINQRKALYIAKQNLPALGKLTQDKAVNSIIANSTVHEITVGNYSFGFLYLYNSMESSYLQPDILKQVIQTIPLEISHEQKIRAKNNNSFSAYLMHLLSDNITDETVERTRATEYSLNLENNHKILSIQIEEPENNSSSYETRFQRTLLTNDLISLLTNLTLSPRIVPSTNGYLILLSSSTNAQDLSNLSARFPERLQSLSQKYPALKITGGCGRAHKGLNGLRLSKHEADIALKVAIAQDSVLLRFADLSVLRLIYANEPKKEINNFVHEKLGELVSQNQARNTDLLKTLASYFDNFGNIKRISEELFTHYNTIAYRLKNIQEITGADFRRATDRFEVELALYLYYLQNQPVK